MATIYPKYEKEYKSPKSYNSFFKDTSLERTSNFINNIESKGLNALAGGPVDTRIKFDPQDPSFAFKGSNNSFSGTDCTIVAIYNENMMILGNLETFSYSIYREKVPVRTLGNINPKGFTYGSRSHAGSMIFVQFDEHPLFPLFQFFNERTDKIHRYSSPLSDDIPPFDIMLIFNNEYGAQSIIRLYGVELFQEGGVFSINDIYSENTIQFVAKDMDPMISAGEENSWKQLLYQKMVEGKVVDNHFASMLRYRQELEAKITGIDRRLNELERDVGFISDRLLTGESQSVKSTRYSRKSTGLTKISKLKGIREELLTEIQEVDTSINNYEKTKMSWDMNTSIQHMDQSTLNTVDRTTNRT